MDRSLEYPRNRMVNIQEKSSESVDKRERFGYNNMCAVIERETNILVEDNSDCGEILKRLKRRPC